MEATVRTGELAPSRAAASAGPTVNGRATHRPRTSQGSSIGRDPSLDGVGPEGAGVVVGVVGVVGSSAGVVGVIGVIGVVGVSGRRARARSGGCRRPGRATPA